jgi:hypothetical protein
VVHFPVCVCACTNFVMCEFVMCRCFNNCVVVLVICVLVFAVFCTVYTIFLLFNLCILILICFV